MEEYNTEDIIRIVAVLGGLTFIAFRRFGAGPARRRQRRSPNDKFRPLQQEYLEPLQQHFRYYQQLGAENKRRFEVRVQAFIDSNEFIPRSYTSVSAEMKALIAGSAIQLTFGFHHLNFEHFNKILIYKDDYYSRITRKYHAGEVNINGIIVLSWLNFVHGYKDHNDGRNLGLHEMAHALRLENAIENGEYDFIEPRHLHNFNRMAKEEIKLIKRGQTLFFRHYAAMNLHEFFAVAVENFFERPFQFRDYKPELYQCMSELLRQDPLKLFPELNTKPHGST